MRSFEPDAPRLTRPHAEAAASALKEQEQLLRIPLTDPERVLPAPSTACLAARLDPLPVSGQPAGAGVLVTAR